MPSTDNIEYIVMMQKVMQMPSNKSERSLL